MLNENWTSLIVCFWKKVWCEVVTAVLLIIAGLAAVNSNFCREFCMREMKGQFHASELNLFSCQSTASLSFKTEMTKVNGQKSLCYIMVIKKAFYGTTYFWRYQQPRKLEVLGNNRNTLYQTGSSGSMLRCT